jgi:hypothetical protein
VDPDACIDWASGLEPKSDRISVITTAMTSLVGAGRIDETLRIIDKLAVGDSRDSAISYTFGALARHDINRARELIGKISGEGTANLVACSLAETYGTNRKFDEMTEVWDNLPDGRFRELFGYSIVRVLAKQDPSLAFGWTLNNSSPGTIDSSLGEIAYAFSKEDPEVGLGLSAQIHDPIQREKFIEKLGLSWGFTDPTKASNWLLDRISDSGYSENRTMGDAIIYKWMESNPDEAYSSINKIVDEASRYQARLAAAKSMASLDPARAAEQIMPYLDRNSSDSRNVIAEVAKGWLEKDPLGASKWISGLDRGALKDVAISKLVSNIIAKDKDIVMANSWAEQIGDPKIRVQVNANIDKMKP